jgi:hypothetical protein
MKMEMIYNITRKLDRLLSDGHQLLSHLGHAHHSLRINVSLHCFSEIQSDLFPTTKYL